MKKSVQTSGDLRNTEKLVAESIKGELDKADPSVVSRINCKVSEYKRLYGQSADAADFAITLFGKITDPAFDAVSPEFANEWGNQATKVAMKGVKEAHERAVKDIYYKVLRGIAGDQSLAQALQTATDSNSRPVYTPLENATIKEFFSMRTRHPRISPKVTIRIPVCFI
ncbi:hypothetical protein [Caballeronia sp. S22]|uniref:hypothetical protein n=1 Tax=Caballeronia sp. S22 TaxID=3137182 RepID=UPI003530D670